MPFDWNQILQSIQGYVPNLIGAIAILILGWLVALIISAIVRGALKRTTLDERLGRWLRGDDETTKPFDIAQGISKGVYYTVMLLVLIAFFQVLGLTIVTEPINTMLNKVLQYLPNLVGAGVLLLIAWILATILRFVVSKGLVLAKVDERFGKKEEEESEEGKEAEEGVALSKALSNAAYWLVFLLFLPAVLDALQLSGLLLPVQGMVDQLLGFLPNLLGAVIILIVGWFIARLVQRLVSSILAGIGADRLGESIGLDLKLSVFVGTLAYVLIFITMLIAALHALELDAVTQPASNMLNLVLNFVPNLFGAAIILGIGWFIARFVRDLVTNLLAAAGADSLSERVGLQLQLSRVMGTVIYALILIPVLIAALHTLDIDAVTGPASNMLQVILAALPAIFTAIAILGVSYVLGRIVSGIVTNILTGVGFNSVPVWLGLTKAHAEGEQQTDEGRRTPSQIIGGLVLIGIMLFAAIEASGLLGFASLVQLLNTFVVLAGRIIMGLIIFAVGLYLANLAANAVKASDTPQSGLLAVASRVTILILTGAMGLRQMGLANEIIVLAFALLLGAAAVAIAIAFGVGGRDMAARQLEQWTESIEEKK